MTGLRVRAPAVAGTFYPSDPDALLAELRRDFVAARPTPPGPAPKAVVAPHAGYVYSGPVAATAYDAVRPLRGVVTRVVLLGPSHRVPLDGIAVSSADLLDTPLGRVRVDAAAREVVLGLPGVVQWDEPHALEHSLEVHLPFLQVVLGDVEVLPLVVGRAPAAEVAGVLDAVWGGPETLIVVSSDLSHYHDRRTAAALDRATAEAVEAGRLDEIGPEDACGFYPLRGLLVVAARRGLGVRVIDLRNSGDTAGPDDRVVGYGAFVVA